MTQSVREEIREAAAKVAEGNPWYTADQIANQRHGVYRHNMRLRYQYVARQLEGVSLDGRTVVDLGCGDGQWSMELVRQHAPRLIGIDYNELRIARYREHLPNAEARFGSCLEIPLEDHTADMVMFHQVLEHIPQPERALREIRRILKPDGTLMLSVPNEGTWLKQRVQYRWIQPGMLQTTDHVNFFTRDSLRRLLESEGFQVDRLDAIGFYFPHNGISRRLLANALTFRLGVAVASVFPVLHDCLFAWCRPRAS